MTNTPSSSIPVVGIGASAGGLEPISEFLASLAVASGFAYVVVQHLDPERKGMLPEVLQRVTPMTVLEAADRMPVQANHVYVIPAGRDLAFDEGRFAVSPAAGERGHRLPIDSFFRSLAQHCGRRAVALLFSGMGADGTRGLAAIRDGGGLTLAQLPSSAQFDSMPSNAILASVVDIVALPGQMAERIGRWWRMDAASPLLEAERQRSGLGRLFQLLLKQTGANFTDYKLTTVLRRVDRRMKLRQCATLDDYLDFVRDNPAEIELLFKELLIGVTQFFRDPSVWEQLATSVLPALLATHPDGGHFKAWVPACSTGEEAYTLAMVFSEAIAAMPDPSRYSLQIFATDLDSDAIERARRGVFGAEVREQLSPERLQRFFMVADDGGYRVVKELRTNVIFAKQNIISDPPFTRLDILCCRNLLIYFTPKLQELLIPLFHYSLKPDGLLVLGSADTPGHFSDLFVAASAGSRVFRRLETASRRVTNFFPTRANGAFPQPRSDSNNPAMSQSLQQQIEQQLLQHHTPAAVLVNLDGDILYIHGRTGAFLEPAAGKANWNIHAMARDSVRYALANLLQRAKQEQGRIVERGLLLRDEDGQPQQTLDLTVEPLGGDVAADVLLLTFTLAPVAALKRRRAGSPQLQELERQLAQAQAEIQTVRNEMQASREELRAANEELQSTNEELQSANEELTTSKEEMQSLNEELHTVNTELQSKVDDLSLVNGDMKNLLNSTDIATIFLDSDMRIRRFTEQTKQIYKLIPADLQRPLGDINNDLDYPDLEQDAREVLRTLVFCERQIPTRSGRWYSVRILPYRTVDNVIAGVVLTFVNITEAKHLEAQLRAVQNNGNDDAGPAPR